MNQKQKSSRWLISTYADFEAGVEETDKLVVAFQGYVAAYGDYLRVVNAYNMHVIGPNMEARLDL